MTAMSPWKMAENRTSIDVLYVDRHVNAKHGPSPPVNKLYN